MILSPSAFAEILCRQPGGAAAARDASAEPADWIGVSPTPPLQITGTGLPAGRPSETRHAD